MPTMEDIAYQAGVSKATVSRVIRGRPEVSKETRKRVLEVAEIIGYISRKDRERLMKKPTMNLGAIFPVIPSTAKDVQQDSYRGWDSIVLRGIEETLKAEEYNIFVTHMCLVEAQVALPTFVEHGRVDGVFIIGGVFKDEYIHRLLAVGLPVVVVGSYVHDERVDCVFADNFRGAYVITEHLLKMGRRRIAFINGPSYTRTSSDKLRGYKAALDNYGVAFIPELVHDGDFSSTSGAKGIKHILDNCGEVDGVFGANCQMAIGAMEFLQTLGFGIPKDISVVGYQDEIIASVVQPALTSVALHSYEMGLEAGRRMLSILRYGDHLGVQIGMPTRLIIRESCGCQL